MALANKNDKVASGFAAVFDFFIIGYNGIYLVATLAMFLSMWSYSNIQFLELRKNVQNVGVDFVRYRLQSDMALTQPTKLYDIEAQRVWMVENIDADGFKTTKQVDPTYFTPPNCVITMPFLSHPIAQGLIVWALSQVFLAIIIITSLTRKTLGEWCYFWIITLSGAASRFNIVIGQTAFLMSALVSGFYGAWLKDKQIIAGIILAIAACFKPQHCFIPFIMVLAKRQWKTIFSGAVTGAIIVALTTQVIALPVVLNYPSALHDLEQKTYSGNYVVTTNTCINLRAILGYAMDSEHAKLIGSVVFLASMLLCYWIWRQSLKKGERSYGPALLITTSISLACNLHSYFYDLTLLILPCALSLEAVGLYDTVKKQNLPNRLFCFSFPIFWTISQVHHALSQNSRNWHLLYLCVYAMWGLYFWRKIGTVSTQPASD